MREIAVTLLHPRLRFDRRRLRRALDVLDGGFRFTAVDRPLLAPPARLRARALSRGEPGSALPPGEVSLVFMTDAALADLHARFLGDPTPTDVITFEGGEGAGTAGEICVSVDMALTCARRLDRPFALELTLYLVHGWLHLAGYDDLRPDRKRRMRAAESRALRLLNDAGALPDFRLLPAKRR